MPYLNLKFRINNVELKKKILKGYCLIFLLAFYILHSTFYIAPVFAQSQSTDISNVYQISDMEAADGDILVTSSDKGLVRAEASYDNRLFGVMHTQSLLVFRRIDNQGTPVARSGTTDVNVTTLGGPINAGDYITSSEIVGKGQKATLSGYVIGVALNSFTENDGQKIDFQGKQVASGKISVALRIEYAELSVPRSSSRLVSSLNTAVFKNIQDPDKFVQVLRYLAAAFTVLVSFGIGFVTFSRSVPKGVEAIGRNPLAEKAILFSIILNIVFTILTAAVGIVAAAFILRL